MTDSNLQTPPPFMKKYPHLRNFFALGIGSLLLGALCAPALADADEDTGSEFNETLVRPAKLVSVSGDVQNADALVEGHEGDTI